MERRALVLTLALTLPLTLYGIPYAYAATTSSTYILHTFGTTSANVHCNSGDYATGGGASGTSGVLGSAIFASAPQLWNGVTYIGITTGQPNAWVGVAASGVSVDVWVVCQTPITVAGIGVPEFGSLYAAIALGAVLYFMMARRYARRSPVLAQNKA
jgi:hypothetical protein